MKKGEKTKITIGKNGAFETIADAMKHLEGCPGTYELEVRDKIRLWPDKTGVAVSRMTITIPTREEKAMNDLKTRIKRLPGYERISRAKVLNIVDDYLAEHPPGLMMVKGCSKEELLQCLRIQAREDRISNHEARKRSLRQVDISRSVCENLRNLIEDLDNLFQTFEDEAKRISEEGGR